MVRIGHVNPTIPHSIARVGVENIYRNIDPGLIDTSINGVLKGLEDVTDSLRDQVLEGREAYHALTSIQNEIVLRALALAEKYTRWTWMLNIRRIPIDVIGHYFSSRTSRSTFICEGLAGMRLNDSPGQATCLYSPETLADSLALYAYSYTINSWDMVRRTISKGGVIQADSEGRIVPCWPKEFTRIYDNRVVNEARVFSRAGTWLDHASQESTRLKLLRYSPCGARHGGQIVDPCNQRLSVIGFFTHALDTYDGDFLCEYLDSVLRHENAVDVQLLTVLVLLLASSSLLIKSPEWQLCALLDGFVEVPIEILQTEVSNTIERLSEYGTLRSALEPESATSLISAAYAPSQHLYCH